MSRPGSREGFLEIRQEIFDVLDSNRQANEIGWTHRARPFPARAMLRQALALAVRGRALEHFELAGERFRGVLAVSQPQRKHSAEAAVHLARGDVVSGMRRQAGIEHVR